MPHPDLVSDPYPSYTALPLPCWIMDALLALNCSCLLSWLPPLPTRHHLCYLNLVHYAIDPVIALASRLAARSPAASIHAVDS